MTGELVFVIVLAVVACLIIRMELRRGKKSGGK